MSFEAFCDALPDAGEQKISVDNAAILQFFNTNGKPFIVTLSDVVGFVQFLAESYDKCFTAWESVPAPPRKQQLTHWEQDSYRAMFKLAGTSANLPRIGSVGESQTRQLAKIISKFICFFSGKPYNFEEDTRFDLASAAKALKNLPPSLDLIPLGREALDTSPDAPAQYYEWLRRRGLTDATIRKYIKDTNSLIKKLCHETNYPIDNLFAIKTSSEIGDLVQHLDGIESWISANAIGNNMFRSGLNKYREYLNFRENNPQMPIPKGFMLIAGISGTGKSRFVRFQAQQQLAPFKDSYLLVPVRPDWHEPSDLLGYISRIDGEKYIPTGFLMFIVDALRASVRSCNPDGSLNLQHLDSISTYWACLDEMNLAPVEQYFSDFLSILETREWNANSYRCDPLIHPTKLLNEQVALDRFRDSLGFPPDDFLWKHFLEHGIPLPPNLVVAGTVNMDETTHGFSRKVIDRAFTIDFGEFFPNDFDKFFEPDAVSRPLAFARYSSVSSSDLQAVEADPGGLMSIVFLKSVNGLLKDTQFELAYRALNELLVSLRCFAPVGQNALYAVWDDFLMTKVLPRIEGDAEKLQTDGDTSLLTQLGELLKTWFKVGETRPDLLRTTTAGSEIQVGFRSPKKIAWMQDRLNRDQFHELLALITAFRR